MKKNVCIVGYGAVGPVHAAALRLIKDINIYAVCDTNAHNAGLCCDEYGCKYYDDFDEMLCDEKIDAIHICTPHYLHKDMAIKALTAGKSVVLEKPLGISRAELEELNVLCKKTDIPQICVMLQNRTNAGVVRLKEIIEERNVGKLQGIIANLNWHRDEVYYSQASWRGRWETEGGGLLINQAVHLVDLMLYFGGKVKVLHSSIHKWGIDGIEVEDTANALIEFENGAKGIFNATNCYVTDESFYLELRFENAHFRYADGVLYEILDEGINILAKDEKVKIGKSYWGCGHQTVICNFYEQRTYPKVEDACAAMQLIFDIYDNK